MRYRIKYKKREYEFATWNIITKKRADKIAKDFRDVGFGAIIKKNKDKKFPSFVVYRSRDLLK